MPLLPQTHHYIGESELKAMKKTAYMINSSRRKMAVMAAENAIAVVGGHEPPNRVV